MFNFDANSELQAYRWRIFAVFFRLGRAQDISDHLDENDLQNRYCRFYNFHQAPTRVKQQEKEHILYQVMYGYYKAFPGHGDLIKVIMERSTQMLNEDCLAALKRLQGDQQKAVIDFCG